MHHTAAVLVLLELLAPVITLEDNEILKVISAPQDVKDIVFSLGSNKFPCLFFFFFFLFFLDFRCLSSSNTIGTVSSSILRMQNC